jgi:hypothetical protein
LILDKNNAGKKAKGGAFMEYPNKLAENIHRIILDIDSDLGTCVDQAIRLRLVKTIYELRDLEHLLSANKVDDTVHHRIQKVLTSI